MENEEAEIFQATLDIRFGTENIRSEKAEDYIRQITGHNCRPKTFLELTYECEKVGISKQVLLRRLKWLMNIGDLETYKISRIKCGDRYFVFSHPLIFYKIKKKVRNDG